LITLQCSKFVRTMIIPVFMISTRFAVLIHEDRDYHVLTYTYPSEQ
jgi:hypothetical protein